MTCRYQDSCFYTYWTLNKLKKMQGVIKISILLGTYGIFKEFRPAEPYLVPYMESSPLNFTAEQISQEIYPVSTYSSFILLVVVFLVTDFLRYKVIIILQSISSITTYLMLIYCRGVFQMQLMQAVYGLYLAADVAYFTYLYAKVDLAHFQEVTSYTRCAYLVGKSLSGIASQVAVSYDITSYVGLLWITVGSEVIALIWATQLPSVDRTMYFHRNPSGPNIDGVPETNTKFNFRRVTGFLWADFAVAFTNPYVVKWAFWWALATGGYYMVTSYIQVLWQAVRAESNTTQVQLNGAVELVYNLLGALASITMGKVQLNWVRLGEPLLAVCSLIIAGLLYTASVTLSVMVAYITFIFYDVTFQTMITVTNSEVAKNINRESYGLVFGITTFAVYLIESLFTYIALQVFALEVRPQFKVYSYYYGVLGLSFVITVIVRCVTSNLK